MGPARKTLLSLLVNASHALAVTASVPPSRLVVSRTMTPSALATSTQLFAPPLL
jgi:hypothetical protein